MRAKPARVTEIAAETIDARLLLKVLSDFKKGDFTTRLPSEQTGLIGKIYDAMNEVFRGRFGPRPPVRTTIAAYGGVPGNSLVEIDCIAAR